MEFRNLFFAILMVIKALSGVNSISFTVRNNCPYTILPALLSSQGTSSSTGFELASQATSTVTVSNPWSGRFWARFVCTDSNGTVTCRSGDCGSKQVSCSGASGATPTTLAEFTIGGSGGNDFYDISLVDGFNLPLKIEPLNKNVKCTTINCRVDINARCPSELSIKNTDGGTIGCKSACSAFDKPMYCCTGDFGSPGTCKPSNYSQYFKNLCPVASTYAFDDKTSTFTCPSGGDYFISFCPSYNFK